MLNENERHTTQQQTGRKGLVIVTTGDGKGKTTAALGIVLRAWGHGMRPCVIQFIKSAESRSGEARAASQLEVEWHTMGDGFTWRSRSIPDTIARARSGWALAQQKIASGQYDIVVLDEFTYPLHYNWLDAAEVIAWLQAHRPAHVHVVITGRDASPALLSFADLITEMRSVKHPYSSGVAAQPGIEF